MRNDPADMQDIYEINTATYLTRLSATYQRLVTLASIPEEEIERLVQRNITAVWLMGIWQRSTLGAQMARRSAPFLREARAVLPDFTPKDIIGSAYSISAYVVSPEFGGSNELAQFRRRLAAHNIKLILDFVPNHTGFDHEWTALQPQYYVQGSLRDKLRHRQWFHKTHDRYIACGRDPQFAPWRDVAQLNAFSRGYRLASIETLRYIASICDGVRCDMAMLMMNRVFHATWGARAGAIPATEYWQEVINAVHRTANDFVFIAECYWDTQAELIAQGFDFCYDKDAYDAIIAGDYTLALARMDAVAAIAPQLVHFLENHDEPRIAALLSPAEHQKAIEFVLSLPGARLWHDGEFEGYRVKVPVQLARGPDEATDEVISRLYRRLLS